MRIEIDTDDLLSAAEAAEILGLGTPGLRRRLVLGIPPEPAFYVGRQPVFSRADVMAAPRRLPSGRVRRTEAAR